MSFSLPSLPYAHDALEPYIDKVTMEIHHGRHHALYVSNLNNALKSTPDLDGLSLEDLLSNNCAVAPESIRTAIRNNGGGHSNHSLFWEMMAPGKGGNPVGNLAQSISSTFGGFTQLKEKFHAAAMGRFGSGWAWLLRNGDNLEISSAANQDSPFMEGKTPIIGLDVWEHAYYLNYQNRRADYISAWWNVVNWEAAEGRFNSAG